MAALQERNGSFRVLFRYDGKQHSFTIGNVTKGEAEAKAKQVDYLLMRLKQRLVESPAGVDIFTFIEHDGKHFKGLDTDEVTTHDQGHGRRVTRTYTIIKNPKTLTQQNLWSNLNVIGVCVGTRQIGNPELDPENVKESAEVRYFIGSRDADAKTYAKALREHWGIENNLHWQLDVSFGEDANRVTKRHGAENLALVRRLALGLLKHHPSKRSIACKRLAAALDPDFLEQVLHAAANSGKV